MPHLTLRTHTGTYSFSKKECGIQIQEYNMYHQADNACGWLFKKFIMDGLSSKAAKKCTLEMLKNGSPTTVDVRF